MRLRVEQNEAGSWKQHWPKVKKAELLSVLQVARRETLEFPQEVCKGASSGLALGGVLARRASFLLFPTRACFCPPPPPSPNNLEYLLAVSKNLAHPLHPVYDDGKGGGWKWWE